MADELGDEVLSIDGVPVVRHHGAPVEVQGTHEVSCYRAAAALNLITGEPMVTIEFRSTGGDWFGWNVGLSEGLAEQLGRALSVMVSECRRLRERSDG